MTHPEIRVTGGPPQRCVCRWAIRAANRDGTPSDSDWYLETYDPRCLADHERPKDA